MSLKRTLTAIALGALPTRDAPAPRWQRDVWIEHPHPNWKRSGVAAAKRAARKARNRRKAGRWAA